MKMDDSTSAKNKIQKKITLLSRQKEELIKFDEQLRHYADMKIKIDLDDGVKVNYSKFGELLADVESITGKD
jgi:short-subunit dehydrogenase